MTLALQQAKIAAAQGEVPVGAALVAEDQLVFAGHNSPIISQDATAHAEINVIRGACLAAANYRLPNTCLYVTLEPCTMCLGAIIHSRISRVVFATPEPRAGAIISAAVVDMHVYNHSLLWTQGVLQAESAQLLQQFFRAKR